MSVSNHRRRPAEEARRSIVELNHLLEQHEHELPGVLPQIVLLLGGACEQLAAECESLGRVIASRTDHLA